MPLPLPEASNMKRKSKAQRAQAGRRMRLAQGGIAAEKQRALDFRMAQGRHTQRIIRLIAAQAGSK